MIILEWLFIGFIFGFVVAVAGITWRQMFEDPRINEQIEEMRQLRLKHHRAVFKAKILKILIGYHEFINIDHEPIVKVLKEGVRDEQEKN